MKTKRCLSALLTVIFVLSIPLFSFAGESDNYVEEEVIERYVNISATSASISISGLTASCYAGMHSKASMSLSIKMELQKLSSGSYSTIQTWSTSKTGTAISLTKSKVINPLSTYRLKVIFNAGGEKITVYRYP